MTQVAAQPNRRPRFTSEQAREAGKRSAAIRMARKAEAAQYRDELNALLEASADGALGQQARAAAFVLTRTCVAGDLAPPRDALERLRIAQAVEILHRVARLEMDESTSNVAHASTGDDKARLADLQARVAMLAGTVEVVAP